MEMKCNLPVGWPESWEHVTILQVSSDLELFETKSALA